MEIREENIDKPGFLYKDIYGRTIVQKPVLAEIHDRVRGGENLSVQKLLRTFDLFINYPYEQEEWEYENVTIAPIGPYPNPTTYSFRWRLLAFGLLELEIIISFGSTFVQNETRLLISNLSQKFLNIANMMESLPRVTAGLYVVWEVLNDINQQYVYKMERSGVSDALKLTVRRNVSTITPCTVGYNQQLKLCLDKVV